MNENFADLVVLFGIQTTEDTIAYLNKHAPIKKGKRKKRKKNR